MSGFIRGGTIPESDTVVALPRLPIISQDFYVPADYFQPGAELPGNYRNERFFLYQDLYDGEYESIINRKEFPIMFDYFNWFKYGADLIRDFIMSFPPESAHPLQEEMNNQLRQAITDYIIHGVAIFAVGEAADEELIETVRPQYFYPLDDDGFAVLNPFGPKQLEVRFDDYSQVFSQDYGDEANWYKIAGTLGSEDGEPKPETPRNFYTVSADPADGIFGDSVFRELAPAVATFTAISSHFLSQQKIGSLIIVAKRETATGPQVSLPPVGVEAVTEGASPIRLAQVYGPVVEGYESFNFIQGAIDSDGYQASLDKAEQRIYDTFGISPSLAQRFNNTGLGVASGVALERTYVRSAATFNEIIKSFLPIMQEILGVEITWENPLAALREDADVEEPANQPTEEPTDDDGE